MITVHLEGSLAKKLGESKLELKVRSVKECLSAMGANFKDFEELLLECSSKYLILIDGVISNSMTALYKKVNKSVRIWLPSTSASVIITILWYLSLFILKSPTNVSSMLSQSPPNPVPKAVIIV